MTQTAMAANTARSIHTAGAVCLVAGLGGAGASIYLAMASPVGAENFMYPHGAPEFTGLQMIIALLRVGLIFGLLGLWWSGAVPISRGARSGRYLALVMMAVLTVIEGLAVTVPRSPMDGTPPAFGVVYTASTILLGVGLLGQGIGVARGGAWQGWTRWLPLSLGVWLLLVLFPALALSFDAARWAMSVWLLLFALLGWVLTRQDGSTHVSPTAGRVSGMRSGRGAAVVTWVYAAAFGAPIVPIAAYIAQNGRLPRFLDVFTHVRRPVGRSLRRRQGPPAPDRIPDRHAGCGLGRVAGLERIEARRRARLGPRTALVPAEAAFWYGFALPLPWLLGLARVILLIAAWKSLSWQRTQTPATR